jgi:uncharacterized short protein YbdD (DUF466 family)
MPELDGELGEPAADLPKTVAAERNAIELVLTLARGVRWWIASVMGDNAYARYVEHLAANHPGEPPPTEREYWRARYAEADLHPGARCC